MARHEQNARMRSRQVRESGKVSQRSSQRPTDGRLEVQFAVSRLLLRFAALDDVSTEILRLLSTAQEWDIAVLWLMDAAAGVLRCQGTWHAPHMPATDFVAACHETALAPGTGLPGQAWRQGTPVWVPDIRLVAGFARHAAATGLGLRAAAAFPVQGSAGPLGAVEFFSRRHREPDDEIVETIAAVGSQLGLFIERTRAEAALRENEARKTAILETALDGIITIDQHGRVIEFNPAAERMFQVAHGAVLGNEIADVIIPPGLRAQHRAGMQRYLSTGAGSVLGRRLELSALRADGTEFPVELAITRVPLEGPPLFTAYLRDISERQRAQRELEERASHAALSGAVGHALTSIDPIRPKLQHCAEAIVTQLGAAFARIWTMNPSEDTLELQASAGLYTHLDGAHSRVPVGALKIGLIAQERCPHLTNNVREDPRLGDREWAKREGMIAFAGYPLIVEGRVVGVLGLFARHELPTSTLDALASVADEIAIAIEQVKAQAQREHLLVAERAARARLQAVLDVLPVGIEIADARGAVLDQNTAARRIWGHAPATADHPAAYVDHQAWWPESGQALAPEEWGLTRALTQGEVVLADELEFVSPDGQRRTVLNSAVPVRDETGAVVGGVAATVDITERKRLERRTREALDALLMMAEALVSEDFATEGQPDSPPGRTAFGDPSPLAQRLAELTCQVLGCQRVTLTGIEPGTGSIQPLAAVGLPPEASSQWWAEMSTLQLDTFLDPASQMRLRAGEALLHQVEELGEARYPTFGAEDTLLVPMRLGGELVGILTTSCSPSVPTDSASEMALTAAVAKLATLVVERERLLRQREEARANELAMREVNRRIGEFLSIASHELKTPLTTIKLNTQVLARRFAIAPDRDQREAGDALDRLVRAARERLGATEQGVNRVLRLVDDLLDLSRIREGRLELVPAPCDLTLIVRQALAEQRQQQPTRSIQLDLPATGPVPVVADADRIGQVLTNYLTNALKYSPADRPVHVRLTVTGTQARVAVRDQGPGLPPAEQVRVWELYHRASGVQVQSGSGVGLGLGLHISRTLIEQHGGQVGVDSVVGDGATFWFTLPLAHPGT